jgi:hypothetical protein
LVDRKDFRRWCRFLKRTFPLRRPVPVFMRRVNPLEIDGQEGDAEYHLGKREYYLVRVSWDLNRAETIEALIHEYSHVLAWQLPDALYTEHDDELHALIIQRINRRWYAWIEKVKPDA